MNIYNNNYSSYFFEIFFGHKPLKYITFPSYFISIALKKPLSRHCQCVFRKWNIESAQNCPIFYVSILNACMTSTAAAFACSIRRRLIVQPTTAFDSVPFVVITIGFFCFVADMFIPAPCRY